MRFWPAFQNERYSSNIVTFIFEIAVCGIIFHFRLLFMMTGGFPTVFTSENLLFFSSELGTFAVPERGTNFLGKFTQRKKMESKACSHCEFLIATNALRCPCRR